MKKNCSFSFRGFTLIELLVAISIIGILFTIGMAQYRNFNRRQILLQASQDLKNNLRSAQSRALAGEKTASWCDDTGEYLRGYRLRFSSASNYLIESVCSDDTVLTIKDFNLPSNVTGENGKTVLFKALGQGVDDEENDLPGLEDPDVSFVITSGSDTKTITVTKLGEINES